MPVEGGLGEPNATRALRQPRRAESVPEMVAIGRSMLAGGQQWLCAVPAAVFERGRRCDVLEASASVLVALDEVEQSEKIGVGVGPPPPPGAGRRAPKNYVARNGRPRAVSAGRGAILDSSSPASTRA